MFKLAQSYIQIADFNVPVKLYFNTKRILKKL